MIGHYCSTWPVSFGFGDILERAGDHGLDDSDSIAELDGFKHKDTIARDVAAVALTTVHGLSLLELEAEAEVSRPPPTLPVSMGALS